MMNIPVSSYLIVCPLVFLAGFVDSIAGGGGLISLPAYMIAGLPVHMAIGTNKLSSGMGTAISTFRLARMGHIRLKQTFFCILAALAGSAGGARLALLLDADIFKRIMLVIIPVTAVFVRRGKALEQQEKAASPHQRLHAVWIALVIGVYDGFYGPGTGTFLILLLVGIAGYSLAEANGIAKSINLTTNLAALAVYFLNGKVLVPLGLAAGLCSIAGNYIGISFFKSKGAGIVKPIMLAVLGIFFVRLLSEILPGVL